MQERIFLETYTAVLGNPIILGCNTGINNFFFTMMRQKVISFVRQPILNILQTSKFEYL